MKQCIRPCLLLLLFMVLLSGSCLAETIIEDGVHYLMSEETATICGFDEGLTEVFIPGTFRGLPTVADEGIDHDVAHLLFEDGIASLEPYEPMFGAALVREVTLPEGYPFEYEETIRWQNWAVYAAYLETINLPSSITESQLMILLDSIRLCYNYSSYDLKEASNDHGPDAMRYNYWRYRCYQNLILPPDHPTLYDIDGVVFRRDTNTLLACLPGRKGAYVVPDGTTTIGKDAFWSCQLLTHIDLPMTVTTIEQSAFYACAGLESITLSKSLKTIGVEAFSNCLSLTSLIIPNGVDIQQGALDYCLGLRRLYVQGSDSTIAPEMFKLLHPECVIYGPQNGPAYETALLDGAMWADVGKSPIKLPHPLHRHNRVGVAFSRNESDLLPLYAKPDDTSEVIAQIKVGEAADVLDEVDGFMYLSFAHIEGFMPTAQVFLQTDDIERVYSARTDLGLTLYDEPAEDSTFASIDGFGDFSVIERFGPWYLIDDEGMPRYIKISDVQPFTMRIQPMVVYVGNNYMAENKRLFFPLLQQPSQASTVIGYYCIGTQAIHMEYFETQEGTYHQVSIDGQEGYLHEDYVQRYLDISFDYVY